MNAKEYNELPEAQRKALYALFQGNPDGAKYLTEFIARAHNSVAMGCVMIPYCGMQVGIEADGYTHS